MHLGLPCVLFMGICAAASHSMNDSRCTSNKTLVWRSGCRTLSWQFNQKKKQCVQTCNKRGPFFTKRECDSVCRSIDVCTIPRPSSVCAGDVHTVYFYNPRTGLCEQGKECTYAGNNFPNHRECRITCMKKANQDRDPRLLRCMDTCCFFTPSRFICPAFDPQLLQRESARRRQECEHPCRCWPPAQPEQGAHQLPCRLREYTNNVFRHGHQPMFVITFKI
uniref:BPTI/Kunitz inhibitor domain-containing protein n=1 Tax=Amblyomma maculatum TaxID=34609 RepID=G3MT97_AMBMU